MQGYVTRYAHNFTFATVKGAGHMVPTHKPPSSLQFDGMRSSFDSRKQPKQLPDHLVRPAIDEEKLFKLREQEKLRKIQMKQDGPKKMSLTAQKHEQAVAKAKTDINLKIKRAEKNMRSLFTELKKLLDKDAKDVVLANSTVTVEKAKAAEQNHRFVQFIFQAWADSTKNPSNPHQVAKTQFIQFCKFMLPKEINETQIMFFSALKDLIQPLSMKNPAYMPRYLVLIDQCCSYKYSKKSKLTFRSLVTAKGFQNPFTTKDP